MQCSITALSLGTPIGSFIPIDLFDCNPLSHVFSGCSIMWRYTSTTKYFQTPKRLFRQVKREQSMMNSNGTDYGN